MSSNVNNNLPLSVSSVSVGGIAGYAANLDTTSQDVATIFQNDVGTIAQYVNSGTSGGTPPTLSDVNGALQELYTILTQGFTPPGGTPSYLTGGMAQQLDPLFRSLGLVGINPATGNIQLSAQQAASWQNLVANSLILQSLFAYASTSVNRSFQSMLELDYVGTGNDLMSTQLGNLQSALSVTQQALDTLGGLQNLHNQIQMSSKGNFVFNYNLQTSLSAYEKMYTSAANAYFKATVAPVPTGFPTSAGFNLATVPSNTFVEKGGTLPVGTGSQGAATVVPDVIGSAKSITDTGAHIYTLATLLDGTGNFVLRDLTAGTIVSSTITGLAGSLFIGSLVGSGTFIAGPATVTAGGHVSFGAITKPTIGSATQTLYGLTSGNATFTSGGTTTSLNNVWFGQFSGNIGAGGTFSSTFTQEITRLQTIAANQVALTPTIQGYVSNSATASAFAFFASTGAVNHFFTASPLASGAQWLKTDATGHVIVNAIPGSIFVQQIQQLVRYRDSLQALITKLSAITPRINATAANPQGDVDPNSLMAKLQQVVSDIRSVFVSNGQDITSAMSAGQTMSGYKNWLLDNYGSRFTSTGIKAGQYQQNITFAITAGQSLNDSQKENVNNFLFVFQQYYQSATAMLQQITQLIQQIAQNVSK